MPGGRPNRQKKDSGTSDGTGTPKERTRNRGLGGEKDEEEGGQGLSGKPRFKENRVKEDGENFSSVRAGKEVRKRGGGKDSKKLGGGKGKKDKRKVLKTPRKFRKMLGLKYL